MGDIRWDPSFETGDALVDEQHRAIHALFADLQSAEDRPDEVMRVLDRLTEYVSMHFATEEDLMERERYPRELIDAHVVEHRNLTDATREKVLAFRAGTLGGIGPLVEFLRQWLANHVHERDRDLVEYCRKRGAAACLPEGWDAAGS